MSGPEPLPDPGDEAFTHGLLQRFRDGDREAADVLFRLHRDRLRRALRPYWSADQRRLLDEDEVLQATLVRALERVDRFEWRGKGAFLAWLVRLARNILRDELRRPSRRGPVGTPARPLSCADGSGSGPVARARGPECTPSEGLIAREEHDLFEQALHELPEADRTLLINRKILQQDYRSLAEDMEMTEGAVRMRMSRVMHEVAKRVERFT